MAESTLNASNAAVAHFMRSKRFRLQVDTLDAPIFFHHDRDRDRDADSSSGRPDPPTYAVPPVLLNNQSRPTGPGLLTEVERAFFNHNGDVWINDDGLAEFVEALTEIFAYARTREWRTERKKRFTLPTPGGAVPSVDVDVALALQNSYGEYTLLVFNCSGKNPSRGVDYEPALVAASLAAFRENNALRHAHRQSPLTYKEFPCLAMVGTAPLFYRVPVDAQLAFHLDRPGQLFAVKKFVPRVTDAGRYVVDGMVPLENRRMVFDALADFKKFVSDDCVSGVVRPGEDVRLGEPYGVYFDVGVDAFGYGEDEDGEYDVFDGEDD